MIGFAKIDIKEISIEKSQILKNIKLISDKGNSFMDIEIFITKFYRNGVNDSID